MTLSFDESSASVENSTNDSIMELSDDDNTDKYRLTSTSDDAEGYFVFYSPVSSSADPKFGYSKA